MVDQVSNIIQIGWMRIYVYQFSPLLFSISGKCRGRIDHSAGPHTDHYLSFIQKIITFSYRFIRQALAKKHDPAFHTVTTTLAST